MKKSNRWILALFAVLALSAAAFAQVPTPAAQTAPQAWPEDMKKLYQEITGNYFFGVEGQSIDLGFYEKDGALFATQDGGAPEEIRPVKEKPLFFETTSSEGNHIEMQFVRDDKGAITKLIVTTQGMTVEGQKLIK